MGEMVQGKVLVVGQGEALSNGGTKWPLVMDNGAQLVTFSEKCKDAVNGAIGVQLTFEVEEPKFEGGLPKVLKVIDGGGAVLWEPSQRSGGTGGDPILQDARTALITAGNLVAARANAYESTELMLEDTAKAARFLATQLKELQVLLR